MGIKVTVSANQPVARVTGLYQWDHGRTLEILDDTLPVLFEVHFSYHGRKDAIVRVCSLANGVRTVSIPDECLAQPNQVSAWVYAGDEQKGQTIRAIIFPLIPRAKPGDEVLDPEKEPDKYDDLIRIVTELQKTYEDYKAKNLIDFKKLERGYINVSGAITGAYTTYSVNNEVTTDFIPISATSIYYFAHRFNEISEAIKNGVSVTKNWFAYNLYDSEKNFIKRKTHDMRSLISEGSYFEGAAYVRISYRTYMFNRPIFAESAVPCEPADEEKEADNLIETYRMVFEGYLAFSGSGEILKPTANGELTSDFIPVEGGSQMMLYSFAKTGYSWHRICFYGADGKSLPAATVITYGTSSDAVHVRPENFLSVFDVPASAVALRISCRGGVLSECVLARNDQERKYLYDDCERRVRNNCSIFSTPFVKSIAHRGASKVAPENTIASFKAAKKAGFDYVECDVSFTSDGVAVLLHDSTIDRTSNGTGNISDMTLETVRGFDFGSWFSDEFAGAQIPTFEEFIALCRNIGLHAYIELKAGTREQTENLVSTVKRYGMKNNVTWISFIKESLGYVKDADPTARIGFIVSNSNQNIEQIVALTNEFKTGHNEVFLDMPYSCVSVGSAWIQACVENDFPAEVWTIDSESTVSTYDPYLTGVTTNFLNAGHIIYSNNI